MKEIDYLKEDLFLLLVFFSCLYGVFEPHNGVEAAKTLLQRMAAEIVFLPLSTFSDEEIRDMLRYSYFLLIC